ncbi:MAG TPA: hypothetical protein VMR52_11495 [Dehalococcoidia bacterium]|nr:hypothetical protein [Dehalococcoidia bacterium]
MPEHMGRLCGDWAWDDVLRELSHYPHKQKKGENEPDSVERLQPVKSVTWYRWSQQPMQAHTGGGIPPASVSRVVAQYEGGGNLTINETDRDCARKLAEAIASAYGLTVVQEGAPGGRKSGNLPSRDEMGRLKATSGRMDVTLDEVGGDLLVSQRKRPFGRHKRSYRTSEVRLLELVYSVKGPQETFEVVAVVGLEGERLPLATYTGWEGWADPAEWRDFTQDLARSLGVEAAIHPGGQPSG